MKSTTLVCMVAFTGITLSAQAQLTWTNRISEPISAVRTVKYVNGGFIAAGDMGTIWTSPDGANWTRRDLGTLSTLKSIAYGAGITVIVGDGVVATSADGTNWASKSGVSSSSVAYGGGRFVSSFVGTESIASSINGTSWLSLHPLVYSTGVGKSYDLAYGAGRFALFGGGVVSNESAGVILISIDGINWTNPPVKAMEYSPYSAWWGSGLAYGSGLFCAIFVRTDPETYSPIGTEISISLDGSNWTNSVVKTNLFMGSVFFANGMFLAPDSIYPSNTGIIHASTDGRTWFDLNSQPLRDCQAIAFGNGTYVAVGGGAIAGRPDGFIVQSSSVSGGQLSASMVRDQGVQVRVLGEVGRNYQLQAAPSVVNATWSNLVDFTLTQPVTNYLDSNVTNAPNRFYRLSSP